MKKQITAYLATFFLFCLPAGAESLLIGSKTFTESVILGEIATLILRDADVDARHNQEFGGTRFCWNALSNGDISAYPEYTGTITHEIFAQRNLQGLEAIRSAVNEYGVRMTKPLGFNNTYVLGMKEEEAEELGIETISDLKEHPNLRMGFSNEFMDRSDGWESLKDRYNLPHENVRGMHHDIAYRGIEEESVDVIDLYATDAEIEYYNLRTLEDDLNHFPEYNALFLYRQELSQAALDALHRLEGQISQEEMIEMNARAKIDGVPAAQVASDFLSEKFGIESNVEQATLLGRLWKTTLDHLVLVGVSMLGAIIIAVPLGIAAAKIQSFGQVILGVVGIIQTIPALALLVFMMPLGIGAKPTLAALFLYSLLPIVRNTYTGLQGINPEVRESAEAMGLPPMFQLRKIELPIAMSTILAGIKTSVVINIGIATLGALVGSGGYGQPIITGIRLDNNFLILQGAVPAALMAIGAQMFFEGIERWMVPKGLRLQSQ